MPLFGWKSKKEEEPEPEEDENAADYGIICTVGLKPFVKPDCISLLSHFDELPVLHFGDMILELELWDLSDTAREIARRELRETDDVVKPAIEELRQLLKEDKELKTPYEIDAWLVRFLRPCKFYPQSAYDLIKRYYAFKVKHKTHYDGLMPTKEQNIFESNILTVSPVRDQLGRRLLILELGKKWNPKKVTLDEVFKGCVLFLEAAMLEPETQVCGAVVIFDMEGLSMNQVWQFTPPFAKRIVDWLQDSVPLRIKNIHIINQPTIFNMVFTLFKPFLREKLRSRIIFHGWDRDSLHQYLNPKVLPEYYGGTINVPRVKGSQWYDLLVRCDQEYEAINSYGYGKYPEIPGEKPKKKK